MILRILTVRVCDTCRFVRPIMPEAAPVAEASSSAWVCEVCPNGRTTAQTISLPESTANAMKWGGHLKKHISISEPVESAECLEDSATCECAWHLEWRRAEQNRANPPLE